MGKHYLSTLFAPKSVAVFGASDRPDSVGQIVFKNMLESGFKGALYPINSKHPEVQGKRAYATIHRRHRRTGRTGGDRHAAADRAGHHRELRHPWREGGGHHHCRIWRGRS